MALPVDLGGVPRRHIFEPLKIDQLRMLAMTQLMEEKVSKAVIDLTYKSTDVLDVYESQ